MTSAVPSMDILQPVKTEKNLWAWLRKGLLALLVLILAGHLFIYLAFGINLIQFPFDYDQAEGMELNNAILIADGKCPYCDNDPFPFYASGYPPFYHVVMVPFVWIFGPEYWYGRLIVFIATLVTAGAIGWAVHHQTRYKTVSLIAGLAFLASNYVYHIAPLLRQHLFMVMLETLAVVLATVAHEYPDSEKHKRRRVLILGCMLLVAAGYTKQLAYATVVAVFLWMFLRNPRRAIIYGAGVITAAGAIFAILYVITNGYWYTNIIASNVNPFVPGQFSGLIKQYLRLHWPILMLAGLMVAYELYFTRLSLYSVWFLAATANTALAGKWGAGDSYFVTSLAAACILAGIFVAKMLQGDWVFPENYLTQLFSFLKKPLQGNRAIVTHATGFLSLGLVLVYSLTVIKLPTSGPIFGKLSDALGVEPKFGHRYPLYDSAGWTVGYAVTGHFTSAEDEANGWKIVDRIRHTDGLVISEDAGFTIQAGREVITNGVQLKNLYEQGKYDPTELITMLENHEFGLIILRAGFYPPPILETIYDAYTVTEAIPMNGFNYELWIPSPTWNERRTLRDYLKSANPEAEPFAVQFNISENEDVGEWLQKQMNRWGWQPENSPESTSDTCADYTFIRQNRRANLHICILATGDGQQQLDIEVPPPSLY
ncbi:MAG: hypothetical protein HY862_09270 [Chloroflexi bacterium]|nr:hypothetical protein [Chloroflexota bacterium]